MKYMTLTHEEVRKDIATLLGKVGSGEIELVNPVRALKISSLYTMPCTLIHAVLACYIYFNISKSSDVLVGFTLITVFSLAMTLVSYSKSLAYLSIPRALRVESVVLGKLKKTYVFIIASMLLFNCIAAGAFFFNEEYILAVPIVFVLGFFITQIALGLEVSRLGIGLLIEKLSAKMSSM